MECVPDYWRAWLNLAIAYELMNDAKNRLLMLKKAYNSNPESHLTCYNLALAYQQLGMGDADVEILLKKSLQINPDFTNAMIVLAEFYYNNDDSQSALNYINKFLEKQPNHIGALYNKTSYLEGLGQEQEALTLLTQLSEIDIAAKAKLALFLRKRGYANKAENILLSVIKDEPNLNYISSYLMTLLFVQSTQKEYEYAYELLNNYKTNDD